VKKNISLVSWTAGINLLIELLPFVTSSMGHGFTKWEVGFVFSIPGSFVTIIMTIATVKIYYYLKLNL
jgi:hypothetical protein